jgi:hypothetical protein
MMGSTRTPLGIGAAAVAAGVLAAVAGCSAGGGDGITVAQTSGGRPTQSPTDGSTYVASPAAIAAVTGVMRRAQAAGTVRIAGYVTSTATGKMTMSGEERYGSSPAMSMTMLVSGETMSEVLVGSKFYMDFPALSAQMGGKPWGEMDLAKDNDSLGSLSSLAGTVQQYDPIGQIAALIASGNMTEIGPAFVHGQNTEHYHGQLILDDLQWNDSAARSLVGSALTDSIEGELEAAGISRENIDLFYGADGLPVEITYTTQTAQGENDSDMVFTGWGKPVQIGAPPAGQVFDLTAQIANAEVNATGGSGGIPAPTPSPQR